MTTHKEDAMRLDPKKLAWAATLTWAIWYTICAVLVALAPDRLQGFLSYVFHYDLMPSRTITVPSYLGGLIGTSVGVWLIGAMAGWIYGALSREQPAIVGSIAYVATSPSTLPSTRFTSASMALPTSPNTFVHLRKRARMRPGKVRGRASTTMPATTPSSTPPTRCAPTGAGRPNGPPAWTRPYATASTRTGSRP